VSEAQASPATPATPATAPEWVDAVGVDELRAKGKLGVVAGDHPLLVVWLPDEDRPVAFHDICIHKQRHLSDGVILNGRIVCPGHQWSYDLTTGHCAARDRYQPTFRAAVVDGRVQVDVSAPLPT
jgi:nitrite reductase/ring-hydroxylating ferredoxin subunit